MTSVSDINWNANIFKKPIGIKYSISLSSSYMNILMLSLKVVFKGHEAYLVSNCFSESNLLNYKFF